MKKELSNAESESVDNLNKELFSPTTIDKFSGSKTTRILEIKEVKSPELKGAVRISNHPITYVVPNEELNESNRDEWIQRMRNKYRVN